VLAVVLAGDCQGTLLYFRAVLRLPHRLARRLPTFRFSGWTYPKLRRIVRVLCAVAGRWRLLLVAAVAVTVAVNPAQALL